ncbi:(2Fe-2S)-binding protein [Pedobacter sp.]|uniref:(2Fe-2S)-binding protein n=1 Tax=Pedobacter sp. TaxID=1411316 RepID=UPI003D7F8BA1
MAKKNTHQNDADGNQEAGNPRRDFLKQSTLITAISLSPGALLKAADAKLDDKFAAYLEKIPLSLEVNGVKHNLSVEPRVTLLDLIREQLSLTGTKKGCDHGQCGACTVHVDGQRVLSCLTLAVTQQNNKVTTIEGVADGEKLHPLQEAFIKHDGFQCGYCTPGQVMSGIACIKEGHAGNDDDIREYMSGNICRCGAYHNIVKAIAEVNKEGLPI